MCVCACATTLFVTSLGALHRPCEGVVVKNLEKGVIKSLAQNNLRPDARCALESTRASKREVVEEVRGGEKGRVCERGGRKREC